jgi:hypothetical protein
MIINLVQINFNSHRVHVSRDDDNGQIICFKYDGSACDFQSFEPDEQYTCADWIVEPLPTISYRVVVGGE